MTRGIRMSRSNWPLAMIPGLIPLRLIGWIRWGGFMRRSLAGARIIFICLNLWPACIRICSCRLWMPIRTKLILIQRERIMSPTRHSTYPANTTPVECSPKTRNKYTANYYSKYSTCKTSSSSPTTPSWSPTRPKTSKTNTTPVVVTPTNSNSSKWSVKVDSVKYTKRKTVWTPIPMRSKRL